VPFVAPLTQFAATAPSADAVGGLIDDALLAAVGAGGTPTGVAFVDFPMDHVFGEADDANGPGALSFAPAAAPPDGDAIGVAADLLATAQRPVIMAGTNVWWGHAEDALLHLAEILRIPVLMNGMARGTVPADHELAFSRARSKALKEADVALVIGVPMDFRLGFGGVFGAETKLIVADRVAARRPHPRPVSAELYGDLTASLSSLAGQRAGEHEAWIADLRAVETAGRAAEDAELADNRSPLHPMRVYAELKPLLDRDAIVVIDAGDFGSYAGRVIDSYVPGAWLDSGPFGCLGSGPGYALAAKLAMPDRQVVLLQGDGAFGFSGMEWDTLVRHGVHVVSVIGNNGIWALEKHPMELLYGYSVVAELRPGTRYDQVVTALGGYGELVATPAELRPALERAFGSGLPAVVNTLTDPAVAYPRRTHSSVNEFREIAEPLYRRDPVENTIELTLLYGDRFPGDALLLTVWDGGRPVGAALQTPPYPLACNGIPASAQHDVVTALAHDQPQLTGVRGRRDLALSFADEWCAVTNRTGTVDMSEMLYRLGTLTLPSDVRGAHREATDTDRTVLVEWVELFFVETFGHRRDDSAGERFVDNANSVGDRFALWEDGGTPVSMAMLRAPAAGVSRVGPVFTPRSSRGRGYGSAVTAAASGLALRGGVDDVVLFTDLANPTSNAIYRRIGYEAVSESVRVDFSSPTSD